MKVNQTYNPCDECPYSYSKNGQESGMCKICEFTYYINLTQQNAAESSALKKDNEVLRAEVADLNNRRHLIWALGVDYDGCNTVESLKELIDELVSYTQLPSDQVPKVI